MTVFRFEVVQDRILLATVLLSPRTTKVQQLSRSHKFLTKFNIWLIGKVERLCARGKVTDTFCAVARGEGEDAAHSDFAHVAKPQAGAGPVLPRSPVSASCEEVYDPIN